MKRIRTQIKAVDINISWNFGQVNISKYDFMGFGLAYLHSPCSNKKVLILSMLEFKTVAN